MTDTVHFASEAPASSPGPVKAEPVKIEAPAVSPEPKPEPVKPVAVKPEVSPEPHGRLTDRAGHEAERGAGLPGVDISGSYCHRPRA